MYGWCRVVGFIRNGDTFVLCDRCVKGGLHLQEEYAMFQKSSSETSMSVSVFF